MTKTNGGGAFEAHTDAARSRSVAAVALNPGHTLSRVAHARGALRSSFADNTRGVGDDEGEGILGTIPLPGTPPRPPQELFLVSPFCLTGDTRARESRIILDGIDIPTALRDAT